MGDGAWEALRRLTEALVYMLVGVFINEVWEKTQAVIGKIRGGRG